MITAVIFDMDGVLIETEEIWSRVRGDVVARHGGEWSEQDQRNVMGDNSRQWSAYIQRTWNLPQSPEEIYREVLEAMILTYRQEGVVVLPGAVETVKRLRASYPLAVASSSPRDLITVALDAIGLADCFRVTVSSDDVSHGKPAPHVFLHAAERLGVSPASCAVIEDSTNGIRAGVAAGMTTIAAPHRAFPPAPDALALASLVVSSLSEVTPEVLAELSRS